MSRLFLVRHGRPLARYDQDHDPGLEPVGLQQAAAAVDELAELGPLPVIVSPLRRTRETAAAFEQRWGVEATVEPAVGEIKSPTDDLAERTEWLRAILTGEQRWSDLDGDLRRWREGVVASLLALAQDTVVVSHFIAINVAVGAATGDDRVLAFRPDLCSCTVLDNDGGALRLVTLGRQAETVVR